MTALRNSDDSHIIPDIDECTAEITRVIHAIEGIHGVMYDDTSVAAHRAAHALQKLRESRAWLEHFRDAVEEYQSR